MLEEIRLAGLGVIDDAVLELGQGFTVVTGETGAGKTMVVTGLVLLLGGRADAALVRAGSDRALVEGRWQLPSDAVALSRAVASGADVDEGELLVARSVSREGRSRAHLGGRAVPVSTLAEVGEELVALHGQSDQQRLLRPAAQRAALDRYAGAAVAEPLARYTAAFERHRAVSALLVEITTRARERAQEADLLRFGVDEIASVAPQPGEETALAAEVSRLSHADALRAAAADAHQALAGDAGGGDDAADAQTLLATARRLLEPQRGNDPSLDALAGRVAEVSYLLADVAADLASYAEGIEVDPVRLEALASRQAALAGLLRKYGEDSAAVLAWATQAGQRLLELDGDDERVEQLRGELRELERTLATEASALSAARRDAASAFGAAVTAEVASLAMPHARVSVAVEQQESPTGLLVEARRVAFGPLGIDDVEIRLAAHPDAPPRPLQRGASGGELSRVMLAVEVVFAGADPVPTLVFDEVDAGVGGKAAVEIGRRLAALAATAQVVAVTHLPQVAAFADRHLVVRKSRDGLVTRSDVAAVDGEERLRELSRMLAGLEDSASAREHAVELLAAAQSAKAGR